MTMRSCTVWPWGRSSCGWTLVALLLGAGLVAPVWAGPERLRALVPSGAGLYLEGQDLARRQADLQDSPLAKRLWAFPALAAWHQQNGPALEVLGRELGRRLGLSWEDLTRKVFGGSAALAVWPPEKLGEDGPLLLLVEAPDAETLRKAVTGWQAALQKSGELISAETRNYAGATYTIRKVRRGDHEVTEFLAVSDDLGLLSNREAILKQALLLRTSSLAGAATDPRWKAAFARTDPAAGFRALVDPRPWDRAVALFLAAAAQREPRSEPLFQSFAELWKGLDYAVFSLKIEDGLSFQGFLKVERRPLSPEVQAVAEGLSGPTGLLRMIPEQSLAAVAGRAEVGPLGAQLLAFLREAHADDIDKLHALAGALLSGLNLSQDVLPGLGPDFGGYVVPVDNEESLLPLEWVGAIQVRQPPGLPLSLAETLDEGLRTMLRFAALAHASEHPETRATVRTALQNGLRIVWVDGLAPLPRGWTIAYTISEGYLLAGNSPGAITRAARLATDASLAGNPRFQELLAGGQPSRLVYLNLAGCRSLLTARKSLLIAGLATIKQAPPEQIERGLEKLETLFQLADQVLWAEQFDEDGLSLRLRIVVPRSESR